MIKGSINKLPRARKDGLIIKGLADETLVYDLENDKAHCLNQTAAFVWQQCDGEKSVSDIAQALAEKTETKADETIVWLALDQLQRFSLLEEASLAPGHLAGMNRRQLVRTLGVAALALPVIVSIAAPTAKAASSCSPPGGACGSNNQCCSTQCCGSPGTVCNPGVANNTCN